VYSRPMMRTVTLSASLLSLSSKRSLSLMILLRFEVADAIDDAFDAPPQLVVESHQAITFLLRAPSFQASLPVGGGQALDALFELFEFRVQHAWLDLRESVRGSIAVDVSDVPLSRLRESNCVSGQDA
jgi:hypothetical protein